MAGGDGESGEQTYTLSASQLRLVAYLYTLAKDADQHWSLAGEKETDGSNAGAGGYARRALQIQEQFIGDYDASDNTVKAALQVLCIGFKYFAIPDA